MVHPLKTAIPDRDLAPVMNMSEAACVEGTQFRPDLMECSLFLASLSSHPPCQAKVEVQAPVEASHDGILRPFIW